MMREHIELHSEQDFACMRHAGRLAAEALDYITPMVQPGISTGELDRLVHRFIVHHDAYPAPLHYRGYPKSICTSLNHVVCHGIPDDKRILQEGDLLNIDLTVVLDGWYGDTSRMFYVGKKMSVKAKKLCEMTWNALMAGIDVVRPGATLGDVGAHIQKLAESKNFSIVRDFCGHGIGRQFHMAPNIMHFGKEGDGLVLQKGMLFTIEPMINTGGHQVKILADNWTTVTRDRSLSAQFEHTIGVTETGYEIFTLSPKKWDNPPYV